MFKLVPELPVIQAYIDRIGARPAVARAKAMDAALAGTRAVVSASAGTRFGSRRSASSHSLGFSRSRSTFRASVWSSAQARMT
jgi:hypothetical protein